MRARSLMIQGTPSHVEESPRRRSLPDPGPGRASGGPLQGAEHGVELLCHVRGGRDRAGPGRAGDAIYCLLEVKR